MTASAKRRWKAAQTNGEVRSLTVAALDQAHPPRELKPAAQVKKPGSTPGELIRFREEFGAEGFSPLGGIAGDAHEAANALGHAFLADQSEGLNLRGVFHVRPAAELDRVFHPFGIVRRAEEPIFRARISRVFLGDRHPDGDDADLVRILFAEDRSERVNLAGLLLLDEVLLAWRRTPARLGLSASCTMLRCGRVRHR